LEYDLLCGLLVLANLRTRLILSSPAQARKYMNQPNHANNSDNPNQEQQPIDLAMRFRKALVMAAVMLALGWAIGVV
jgi:hypothetical protein